MPANLDGQISRRSSRGLDWLNFFMADTQTGVGPFLAIYLASTYHWDDQRVGIALSVAAFAGVLAQLPAGALVDWSRSKRAVIAVGVGAVVTGGFVVGVLSVFYGGDLRAVIAGRGLEPCLRRL